MNETLDNPREYETLATMANAVQLGTNVITAISGNDIADGIDGKAMTSREISDVMAAKLNAYLSTGGSR